LFYVRPDLGREVKDLQYSIKDDQDLQKLIKLIPNRFLQIILPYFDQNSSLERADALLNENPRNLPPHNWSYPYKAMMGLIAAKLTKNPKFAELRGIYEEELAPANPTLKEEFDKLKIILENY
jgi:hypothetical protein